MPPSISKLKPPPKVLSPTSAAPSTKQVLTAARNGPAPKPILDGVLARIQPLSFNRNAGIKVLCYGGSGSGKTRMWSTFPGPILAIICSGGLKPGELLSIDTPENCAKVSQVVLHQSGEIRAIVDHVKTTDAFKTIVLDHISGLQDLILKEIGGFDEIPISKFKSAGKGESWGVFSQQQYGEASTQCKEHLRAMLNLDCNIVIIAQERIFGGREDGISSEIIQPTVGAGVIPSLAAWLNPACDYIIQMYKRPKMVREKAVIGGKEVEGELKRTKEVEFCARTAPSDVFITKFRVPKGSVIPECIVDPDYDKLMAVIRGTYKEEGGVTA